MQAPVVEPLMHKSQAALDTHSRRNAILVRASQKNLKLRPHVRRQHTYYSQDPTNQLTVTVGF